MPDQSFKSHGRYVPLWHFITGTAIVVVLVGSIIRFCQAKDNYFSALQPVLVALILVSLFWYARAFALRAQDRAIRAEENFRHFVLTGKPFDDRLVMGQIIGLRFASDAEMPALAKKAADENLSSSQIKGLIKDWRADHHRA